MAPKNKKREQLEKEQKERAEKREKERQEKERKEKERKEREEEERKKKEAEERERERIRKERNAAQLKVYDGFLEASQRPRLLTMLRKATLCHDDLAQEILVNHLLRNYIHHNLYQEADLLVSNTKDTLSQPFRSNNQMARYCYYIGRIKIVQLHYNEAHDNFQQALRKAPDKAIGFKTIATKMSVVVQLLMGEIPPRSVFRQPESQEALYPYLQLTSAVRFGQLQLFNNVVNEYTSVFKQDSTYTLVQRIHQNVIKTGLRRITHAYTKIAISDICNKLQLDNPEDAEYIVAKAIRDGVIDATIDHDAGTVISTEIADVYSSPEPAAAFHRRIQHLTDTHNQAIMTMRYMPEDEELEDKDAQEREKRKEEEKALEEALEEDDEMDI
jgi:26S proteasome regulatory subunit N3|eukprot:CAMPEP_0174288938 /NCGR_PEP_ID=MMETSP0809-20121228/22909_1 /TAXON_ID=73025 ORGANISM="Eutreptiella gymnastica-like, Strain CCMP1594" /NCGR_SAMPLE_ID=MMETSP0809 /ASSEMBLY_ACC=CAM_ASM_000658 /LENGTH=385 /DNA_ID=CAMNT_0015386537 /DNA_START=26 /DNA_END=1183 /DNA_ORIENTATION=+